jgi:hypothetical protein
MLLLLHGDRELTSQRRRCTRAAATIHRLELGGRHTEPRHLRLVRECTDICRACAKNCQDIGDMDDCVQGCERCAESFEQMLQAVAAVRRRRAPSANRSLPTEKALTALSLYAAVARCHPWSPGRRLRIAKRRSIDRFRQRY